MFNKILKLIKEEYVTSYKFPWTHDETDVFKNPTISDINHIKDNRGYFDKKLDFIENPESAKVSLYVVEPTNKLNEQSDKGVEDGA